MTRREDTDADRALLLRRDAATRALEELTVDRFGPVEGG